MARYRKLRFHDCPDTTYLLTSVMLMEEMQYARIDAPGLALSREKMSAILLGCWNE